MATVAVSAKGENEIKCSSPTIEFRSAKRFVREAIGQYNCDQEDLEPVAHGQSGPQYELSDLAAIISPRVEVIKKGYNKESF